MLISPEIPNRNSTILRKPRVSSARFRRFAGVSSGDLAIFRGISAGVTLLAKKVPEVDAGSTSGRLVRLAGHVRVVQDVVTLDLDLEVRAGIAVDVALDDREVAVGA